MSLSRTYYYRSRNFDQRIVIEPFYAFAPAITTGHYKWMHDEVHADWTDDDYFAIGETELQGLAAYANRLFEVCEEVNAYLNHCTVEEYLDKLTVQYVKLDHMAFWMRFTRQGKREGYYEGSVLKYSPIEKGWEDDFNFQDTYANMLLIYEFLVKAILDYEDARNAW